LDSGIGLGVTFAYILSELRVALYDKQDGKHLGVTDTINKTSKDNWVCSLKLPMSGRNMTFLSKAERDYLVAAHSIINHDYVCVKSRLQKKLKVFLEKELPLLIEKGYLANIAMCLMALELSRQREGD
jgi:hypothetical protein